MHYEIEYMAANKACPFFSTQGNECLCKTRDCTAWQHLVPPVSDYSGLGFCSRMTDYNSAIASFAADTYKELVEKRFENIELKARLKKYDPQEGGESLD